MSTVYDAVIIGGGHNGLVAACYLAKAGKKVLLLERNDYLGGAATSQRVFADYEASLSRYAYLVSLLPNKIIQDLGLSLELRRRRTASFTPFTKKNTHQALWLSNENETHNLLQIEQLGAGEYNRWQRMQYLQQRFAQKVWDSFLMPLQSKEDFEKLFQTDDEKIAWRALVEEPIGKFIESHIKDNILRGVVLTDAKIGAFTHAQDPTLLQNRTYLYHIIGNKTGEWRVPVGGMGAVSGALVKKATEAHATLLTQADVKYLHQGAKWHTVAYEKEGQLVE
ncbi:MAG: phytoene desaturase family protein, partial [Runella sp.]